MGGPGVYGHRVRYAERRVYGVPVPLMKMSCPYVTMRRDFLVIRSQNRVEDALGPRLSDVRS